MHIVMHVLQALLLAVCGAVAVPNLVLFVQTLSACLPSRRRRANDHSRDDRPSMAVIVPAHDEEAGIRNTIESVKEQLRIRDRLIVVAHNCIDSTAVIARKLGVEVVVCRDPHRVGKGFALQAGYDHVRATASCDIVVIVDADCRLGANALDHLARACQQTGTAVQARYLMRPTNAEHRAFRLSSFAWLVRNHVRPLGYARLGLGCHLMGTGMAFPLAAMQSVEFATGHIVEDLVLGAELTLKGYAPRYCEAAYVTSQAPASETGREVQRTRWIHGHLLVLRHYAPALIWSGLRRGRPEAFFLGVDLLVPPLTMLLAADLIVIVATLLWLLVSGAAFPAIVATAIVSASGVSLAAAWLVHGRSVIGLRDLVSLPSHLLTVARIATRFFRGARSGWTRSERA